MHGKERASGCYNSGSLCVCIMNGLMYRRNFLEQMTKLQLVLPYSLHCEVLKELHEGAVGGHLGESKMLGRLKERFYWPRIMGGAN